MGDQVYLRAGVTRAERILGALGAHPDGLSATEIAELTENPGHVAMIRCSGKLDELTSGIQTMACDQGFFMRAGL